MIDRMEVAKADLFYQTPENFQKFKDNSLEVNFNSLNLAVSTLMKVYIKSIEIGS